MLNALAIVLTAVITAITTFFFVTEEGRLLLKILYYRVFPKQAEEELRRMLALVDNQDRTPCMPMSTILAYRLFG